MKKVPLTWLQAFEAAGRTGSFKAAAAELNVSPSNVSHQIRDLETYLGTLLFSRSGRQVTLTREGERYLPALTDGFQRIREASLHTEPSVRRLHLGAFPFLANEVIAPRLTELKARLGDTEIRIFTHTDLKALTHGDPGARLDVVVRYGAGRFPGLVATRLADVAVVPIQSVQSTPIRNSAALLQQPLIRVLGPFQGWEQWRDHFVPDAPLPAFTLETDSFHAAMQAVERGDGVSLGVLPYLNPWLRDGRVRALADFELPIRGQGAYAVHAPFQTGNPVMAEFLAWLKEALR